METKIIDLQNAKLTVETDPDLQITEDIITFDDTEYDREFELRSLNFNAGRNEILSTLVVNEGDKTTEYIVIKTCSYKNGAERTREEKLADLEEYKRAIDRQIDIIKLQTSYLQEEDTYGTGEIIF